MIWAIWAATYGLESVGCMPRRGFDSLFKLGQVLLCTGVEAGCDRIIVPGWGIRPGARRIGIHYQVRRTYEPVGILVIWIRKYRPLKK